MELVRLSNLLGLIAIDARAETDTLLLFVLAAEQHLSGLGHLAPPDKVKGAVLHRHEFDIRCVRLGGGFAAARSGGKPDGFLDGRINA